MNEQLVEEVVERLARGESFLLRDGQLLTMCKDHSIVLGIPRDRSSVWPTQSDITTQELSDILEEYGIDGTNRSPCAWDPNQWKWVSLRANPSSSAEREIGK